MVGVDGIRMLNTTDLNEAIVLASVSRRGQEIRDEERVQLAKDIRNQIVEAWNKGKK